MKKGWQTKTLGDVAEIGAGNSAPQAEALFENGTHPFFRTADAGRVRFGEIYESSDYLNEDGIKGLRLFPKGTILLPKSGASTFLNHRVMLGVDGYVASHLATIVADSNQVDQGFLLYFLSTISAQDLIQDHAYPSLNLPVIAGINIQVPPLSEQKQIVNVLDEVFEKTAKAKENAEKNLQNARELFESYLHSIFANPGDNWEEKNLGECFKLRSGDNITSKMMNENGKFPVYGGNGIAGRYDKYNLSGSNIVIGRVGALCGNVRHLKEEIWLTDNAFKVTDWKYDFDHAFLTYLLNFKNLRSYARQAAQPVISNSSLESVLLQFPESISEQKNIVSKLDSLSAETKKLEAIYKQKLTDLEELKKSVLHKAFNGELAGACS